jgi:outer membrane receptor protein involved in Fe transport
MAVFGEMDIVLIEDRLTALVGGRWYDVDRDLSYTVERPDSRVAQELPDRKASDDGFIPKYGLELQINDDVMVYGVYSEGYRVGGTNRGRGIDLGGPTLPVAYESDILENTEFGLKSTFADGRFVFNAVYYDMKWNDMQIEVTDPSFNLASYSEVDVNGDPLYGSIPFQIVVGNVGDATVTGIDIDLKALIGESLEFGFNLTDIRDAYVEAPAFYSEPRAVGGQIPSGLDPQSALPLFADESYSFYLEYSGFNIMGGDGAFRLQHNNVGSSLNQLNDGFTSARLKQGEYKITDAILTIDMDDWQARVYINNLSDERGITYEDSADFDPLWGRNSSNVIRPRNWGLSIRKRF